MDSDVDRLTVCEELDDGDSVLDGEMLRDNDSDDENELDGLLELLRVASELKDGVAVGVGTSRKVLEIVGVFDRETVLEFDTVADDCAVGEDEALTVGLATNVFVGVGGGVIVLVSLGVATTVDVGVGSRLEVFVGVTEIVSVIEVANECDEVRDGEEEFV